MHHEEMTIGRKIQEKLYKLLTFTPPLFLGRGIFQYSFGIMPFRKEVFTVGTYDDDDRRKYSKI